MATKKKARRVSTVFGKQKVMTTPEVAAKIKSGQISPDTHTFSQNDGSVKFAPKRRAVVGGNGIIPTANSAAGSIGASANSAAGSIGALANSAAGSMGALANSAAGSIGAGYNRATGDAPVSNKASGSMGAGANRATGDAPVSNKASGSMGAGANRATGNAPTSDKVPQTGVPTTDKATGQPITPAQKVQMQEQQAIKVAPFKADLAALSTQINDLMSGLDSAEDDDQIGVIRQKIDAFKSAIA